MNQQEIEFNRKCTEFMELKKDSPNINWYYDLKKGRYFRDIELLYHSDWNWIMEVVEKIESLGFDVFINTYTCTISDVGEDRFENIEHYLQDNKKGAVVEAISEFLIWYNANK